MDRAEKASEVIEQAIRLGLKPEFDGGLNVVTLPSTGDLEKQREVIQEITKRLADIRPLLEGRAVAARARKFLGQQICCPEIGVGTLADVSSDGTLQLSTSIGDDRSKRRTTTANARSVLIIRLEETDGATAPAESTVEPQRKRFLGLI